MSLTATMPSQSLVQILMMMLGLAGLILPDDMP